MTKLWLKTLVLLALVVMLWTAVTVSASPIVDPRLPRCFSNLDRTIEQLNRIDIPTHTMDYRWIDQLGSCPGDAPVLIIPVVSVAVLSPAG